MFKVRADLGGSGLRFGNSNTAVLEYESPYKEIQVGANKASHVQDKYSDFIITSTTNTSLNNRRFVRAEVAEQYRGSTVYCDNNSAKVLQEVTYVNSLYCIGRLMLACTTQEPQDIDFLCCIPAGEFYDEDHQYVEDFRQQLAGHYSITFPLLGSATYEFELQPDNIHCVAEGVVAAYAFKADQAFKRNYTLIVDVGQRSTDITMLHDYRPMGAASRSVPVGGMNIEAVISSMLEKNGTPVVQEDTRHALETGVIYVGDTEYNVAPFINKAKKEFAVTVKEAILQVIANAMLNIRNVTSIFVLGRPFLAPKCPDVECLTDLLLAEIGTPLQLYTVENPGLANISQVMQL